jgi:hypothetical protein
MQLQIAIFTYHGCGRFARAHNCDQQRPEFVLSSPANRRLLLKPDFLDSRSKATARPEK